MIALVDYGAGNLRSVENALRAVGAEVVVTHDPDAVRRAERIVVPGQGSMKACADAMRASGCAEALVEGIRRGARVLGICVGLQMLFEDGEEHGGARGLGLLPGTIARLPSTVKLPHIGWSQVRATPGCHPLFRPLDGQFVYFAHSFAAGAGARGVSLLADHGRPYCAALADGHVYAVQFHPEKSQKIGLALLERFVRAWRRAPRVCRMLLIPAIDLMDGQVVRLEKGDFARRTTYSADPAAIAASFRAAGAERVHVVDLDGARAGRTVNGDAVRAIAGAGVPIEVGGGLRDLAAVERVLALGAAFAVLGTAAVERLDLVREAARRFPGRIVCGIDAKGGEVAVAGWAQGTGLPAAEVARRVREAGVALVEYTDVARDGMFTGVDAEGAARLAREAGVEVVASGGVATLDDVRACRAAGLAGVIVGKALYEGRIDLGAAIRVAKEG